MENGTQKILSEEKMQSLEELQYVLAVRVRKRS